MDRILPFNGFVYKRIFYSMNRFIIKILFLFIGMHQQAEAIEAQVKTRQAGAPAPPGGMMPGKFEKLVRKNLELNF